MRHMLVSGSYLCLIKRIRLIQLLSVVISVLMRTPNIINDVHSVSFECKKRTKILNLENPKKYVPHT